jgi:hypothetical protein
MFKVECYTAKKLQGNPVAFVLRDSRYKVEEVIDRWYGEGSSYYKVKADDGNIYLLKYDNRTNCWEWVFYQDPKKMNALPYSSSGMNPLRKTGWEEMEPDNRYLS